MLSNRISIILASMFFLGSVIIVHAEEKPEEGLLWVLPDAGSLKTLKPEDTPRQAKAEGLYDLIDGGASVYISNGFKHALLQDYRSEDGLLIYLEVYQLNSPENAKKVFALKGGDPKKAYPIGQGGCLEDYYGLFLQGSFFVTVTASESTEQARKLIKQIASATIKKLKTGN